jgi:hypothetical protein
MPHQNILVEQVSSKGMAEGVAADALGDFGQASRLSEGFLDAAGVERMTIGEGMPVFFFDVDGGEDVLPAPLLGFVGVLFGHGKRQGNLAVAASEIALMGLLDNAEVVLEGFD